MKATANARTFDAVEAMEFDDILAAVNAFGDDVFLAASMTI